MKRSRFPPESARSSSGGARRSSFNRRSRSGRPGDRVSESFLSTPLQYLKGVGPRRAADLGRIGLRVVGDLLERFPLRYEDRGRFRAVATLKPGEQVSVCGEIADCGLRATRRPGFTIFEALGRDATGAVRAGWLNQPVMRDVLRRPPR